MRSSANVAVPGCHGLRRPPIDDIRVESRSQRSHLKIARIQFASSSHPVRIQISPIGRRAPINKQPGDKRVFLISQKRKAVNRSPEIERELASQRPPTVLTRKFSEISVQAPSCVLKTLRSSFFAPDRSLKTFFFVFHLLDLNLAERPERLTNNADRETT